MKKNNYTAFAGKVLLLALAGACSREAMPSGMTEIRIIEPMVYGGGTKWADETKTTYNLGDGHNGFNQAPALTSLPVGSTVWLTYRTKKNDTEWNESNLQAYVILNASGYNALYPCSSSEDADGYLTVDDPINITTPLYLKDGDYQFRMVGPANRIKKTTLSMQVDNGMYIYSNDERYDQTSSKLIKVQSSGSGVQNIVLNPMIHQMARIKVKLNKGEHVYNMEMLPSGIEISGLQEHEEDNTGLLFHWSSLEVKDTLEMKKASKYSRASIKQFTYNSDGTIEGDIGILPTDCMSTSMLILLNVAVNGIPTQYLLTLEEKKFYHGHSYNLNLSIGLDGNITVLEWDNVDWKADLDI